MPSSATLLMLSNAILISFVLCKGQSSGGEESETFKKVTKFYHKDEDCYLPCENGGVCIAGRFCKCLPSYSGKYCQDYSMQCHESPKITNFAFLYSNKTFAKVQCYSGFRLEDGRDSYSFLCMNGTWMHDGDFDDKEPPKCIPICEPACQNGGICVKPNICQCLENYRGQKCEEEFCESSPPTLSIMLDSPEADKLCPADYYINRNTMKVEIICIKKKYQVVFKQLQCDPACSPPCENGGHCVKSDVCFCLKGFEGDRCRSKKCLDRPKNIRHASVIKFSLNQVEVECNTGYKFMNGASKATITCVKGNWSYPAPFSAYQEMKCLPVCSKPCVNGGLCVAPRVCNCPEGFTGDFCEKRYKYTVEGNTCIFPFQYRGQTYVSCTDVDHTKPWCPTEVDDRGFIQSWEMCYSDLGRSKLLRTEEGIPCQIPLTENGMTFHHCIQKESNSESSSCVLMSYNKNTHSNSTDGALPPKEGLCVQDFDPRTVEEVVLFYDGSKCTENSDSQNMTKNLYEECVLPQGDAPSICEQELAFSNETKFCLLDQGWTSSDASRSGKPCRFPYVVNGIEFYGCVTGEDGMSWCPTEINSTLAPTKVEICVPVFNKDLAENRHSLVLYNGKEGRKPELRSIRVVETSGNHRCVFPFNADGEWHYDCVSRSDIEISWCATKVDGNWSKPLDSNICLPSPETYFEKLLDIQFAYKGHSNEESMKKILEEVDSLNEDTFLRMIRILGWQRFLLMLNGVRVFQRSPHKGMTLKYRENDEYLRQKITDLGIPSENILKAKGIPEILKIFGASCCLNDVDLQAKIDFFRNGINMRMAEFMNDRKISFTSDLTEASVLALRNFNIMNLTDGNYFEQFLNYGRANRPIKHNAIHDVSELDYFVQTSIDDRQCKPFIHEGQWYGYGACIKTHPDDEVLKCATVVNQKYQPKVFSECKIQEEFKGSWPHILDNHPLYDQRVVFLTKTAEPCNLPFFARGELQHKYILKLEVSSSVDEEDYVRTTPFGYCPVMVDEDFNPIEMLEYDKLGEMYIPDSLKIKTMSTKASTTTKYPLTPPLSSSSRLFTLPGSTTPPLIPQLIATMMPIVIQNPKLPKKIIMTIFKNYCIFPFVYKGKFLDQCYREGNEHPWCATEIYNNGAIMVREPCDLSTTNVSPRLNYPPPPPYVIPPKYNIGFFEEAPDYEAKFFDKLPVKTGASGFIEKLPVNIRGKEFTERPKINSNEGGCSFFSFIRRKRSLPCLTLH